MTSLSAFNHARVQTPEFQRQWAMCLRRVREKIERGEHWTFEELANEAGLRVETVIGFFQIWVADTEGRVIVPSDRPSPINPEALLALANRSLVHVDTEGCA